MENGSNCLSSWRRLPPPLLPPPLRLLSAAASAAAAAVVAAVVTASAAAALATRCACVTACSSSLVPYPLPCAQCSTQNLRSCTDTTPPPLNEEDVEADDDGTPDEDDTGATGDASPLLLLLLVGWTVGYRERTATKLPSSPSKRPRCVGERTAAATSAAVVAVEEAE